MALHRSHKMLKPKTVSLQRNNERTLEFLIKHYEPWQRGKGADYAYSINTPPIPGFWDLCTVTALIGKVCIEIISKINPTILRRRPHKNWPSSRPRSGFEKTFKGQKGQTLSLVSLLHKVSEDKTSKNWSHNSEDTTTYKLALIQVTIRVWKSFYMAKKAKP